MIPNPQCFMELYLIKLSEEANTRIAWIEAKLEWLELYMMGIFGIMLLMAMMFWVMIRAGRKR